MTDTNDMRHDFEAWCETFCGGMLTDKDDNAKLARLAAWSAWQAATERAAKAVEAMTERRRMNSSQKPDCEYAAAIRQGGAK